MPFPSTDTRPTPPDGQRRTLALLVGLALLLLLATLVLSATAKAQSKSAQLDQVRERQDRLAGEIQSQNGEVNRLIAQVSRMREQEDEVNAELAERQAELERTTAELADGRKQLDELREELDLSSAELEELLVSLYKNGSPDVGMLLLDSSGIEDFALQNEYFDRLQGYQSSVIERARVARDETDAMVTKLAGDRDRISTARDEIAARRDQLASSRTELQAEEASLQSARKSRRQTLASLDRREGRLVQALSTPEPQPQAPASSDAAPAPAPAPVAGETAKLGADGKAIAPAGAPAAVKEAIAAGNEISSKPYLWGGGHGSFEASGYDCSGAISYALHGAGLVSTPLDSTGYMFWGEGGAGRWITVYANPGHAYVVIAGLRFDTSGGAGPRWQPEERSSAGFAARHPSGL